MKAFIGLTLITVLTLSSSPALCREGVSFADSRTGGSKPQGGIDKSVVVDPETWIGTYEYTESPGRTAGGTGIVIGRTIKVESKNNGLVATLKSEGFQTDETLICDCKCEGNRLVLLFRSYPDGKTINNFGIEIYKRGAKLLTLERSQIGLKTRLLTYWGAFKLNDERAKNGRVYFEKTGSGNVKPAARQTAQRRSGQQFAQRPTKIGKSGDVEKFNRPQEQRSCPVDFLKPGEIVDQVHYPLGVSFRKFRQIMDSWRMLPYLERVEGADDNLVGYRISDAAPSRPSLEGQPWSPTYLFAEVGGVYRLMAISGMFASQSVETISAWAAQEFGKPSIIEDAFVYSNDSRHPRTVMKLKLEHDRSMTLTILDPEVVRGL